MDTYYRKKIPLSEEEIKDHQVSMLNFGIDEQGLEDEMIQLVEGFAAEKKEKSNKINLARSNRLEHQKILQFGFKYEDVPYHNYADEELKKYFVINTEFPEILEIKDIPVKHNGELEFYQVVKITNEEEAISFFETLRNDIKEDQGDIPEEIEPLFMPATFYAEEDDENIEVNLFALQSYGSLRIFKLSGKINIDKFKTIYQEGLTEVYENA